MSLEIRYYFPVTCFNSDVYGTDRIRVQFGFFSVYQNFRLHPDKVYQYSGSQRQTAALIFVVEYPQKGHKDREDSAISFLTYEE